MTRALVVACLLAAAPEPVAAGQDVPHQRPLSSADIQAAIRDGLKADVRPYTLRRTAWSWAASVNFSTPYLRVALAAHSAKRKYLPFSEADVTPEMIAPELHVYAFPRPREGSAAVINVEAVVITPKRAKDRQQAIHPLRSDNLPLEFRNLLGYSGEGQGLLAVFPLALLTEEHEIHVVYDQRITTSRQDSGTDVAFPIRLKNVK